MFRYEDEVFGDSEPELDEGELNSCSFVLLLSGISIKYEAF